MRCIRIYQCDCYELVDIKIRERTQLAIFLSLALASTAAVTTVISVRYSKLLRRRRVFAISMISLAGALYWGESLGGFWPGAYTLFAWYMLLCTVLPWINLDKLADFLMRRHVD